MPTEVQSVIIPRSTFTLAKAKKWIKKNGYKESFYRKKVDITKDFYRFRQTAPKYKKYRNKKLDNGVMLVLGITGK